MVSQKINEGQGMLLRNVTTGPLEKEAISVWAGSAGRTLEI